jgi:hypothetical protein
LEFFYINNIRLEKYKKIKGSKFLLASKKSPSQKKEPIYYLPILEKHDNRFAMGEDFKGKKKSTSSKHRVSESLTFEYLKEDSHTTYRTKLQSKRAIEFYILDNAVSDKSLKS